VRRCIYTRHHGWYGVFAMEACRRLTSSLPVLLCATEWPGECLCAFSGVFLPAVATRRVVEMPRTSCPRCREGEKGEARDVARFAGR